MHMKALIGLLIFSLEEAGKTPEEISSVLEKMTSNFNEYSVSEMMDKYHAQAGNIPFITKEYESQLAYRTDREIMESKGFEYLLVSSNNSRGNYVVNYHL